MIKRKASLQKPVKEEVIIAPEWFKPFPCKKEWCSYFGKGICKQDCEETDEI